MPEGFFQKHPRPPSQLRRNLRLCSLDGLVATPFVYLTIPGNILMAAILTDLFAIGKGLYGLIISLPAWFNALQVFLIPLIARRFSTKSTSLFFACIHLLLWFAMTLGLGWLPPDDAALAGRFFILFHAVLSLTTALAGVSWTAWIQEWTPRKVRGNYFGRRNRLTGLSTIAFLLIASQVIERGQGSVEAYQLLLGGTGLLRALGLWFQWRTISPTVEPEPTSGLLRNIRQLARQTAFMRFVLYTAVATFMMNISGAFIAPFLYEQINWKVEKVAVLSILASLTAALAMPLWGRFSDRYGCKAAIIVSVLAWEGQNFLWTIITPERSYLLYPMWVWGGAASAGFFLGTFNMLLKVTPRSQRSSGISFHLAVTSLAAALSPIFAGLLLQHGTSAGWDSLSTYHGLFFIRALGCIGALLLLYRLVEPEARGINHALGGLRTLRQSFITGGLAILTNMTVARHRKHKPTPKLTPKEPPNT